MELLSFVRTRCFATGDKALQSAFNAVCDDQSVFNAVCNDQSVFNAVCDNQSAFNAVCVVISQRLMLCVW